jgi:hypothetical protein
MWLFWRSRGASGRNAGKLPAVAVIPARDEADVINATIDSLLSQNYPGDFSVVLVDDHSSDGPPRGARPPGDGAGSEGDWWRP